MSENLPTRHALKSKSRRRATHIAVWAITTPLLIVVALAAWIGFRALEAKSNLEAAQASIGTLKDQVLAFDGVGAQKTLDEVSENTASAVSLTSDPIWRAAEMTPVLGVNLSAVREIAAVTDEIVVEVAKPLVSIAGTLNPTELLPPNEGINVQLISNAIPVIVTSNEAVKSALSTVEKIDTDGAIDQVAAAQTKMLGLLGSIAPALDMASSTLPLVPPALGADAPRKYVVVFQNNAESRPLGGTALSFAVVNVDKGKIDIAEIVPAGFENFPKFESSVIPIPSGVSALNPGTDFGTFIADATVRPDFSTAAQIVQANWQHVFGVAIDGVISIDPVALSYLLRTAAPTTLSTGDVLDGNNLVPFLLNTLYQRFDSGDPVDDNRAQDAVYEEVVAATIPVLMGGGVAPTALISGAVQATTERRIMFWSPLEQEQTLFRTFGIDGALPISDATTEKVGLYVQDAVGSKLNYYLNQSVDLQHGTCRPDGRPNYRVSSSFYNALTPDLVPMATPSILGQWKAVFLDPGVQRLYVTMYVPPGAVITGATIDGVPQPLEGHHDDVYPVGKLTVSIPPGATATVTYDFVAALPGERAFDAQITPLAHPVTISNSPIDCATVAQ